MRGGESKWQKRALAHLGAAVLRSQQPHQGAAGQDLYRQLDPGHGGVMDYTARPPATSQTRPMNRLSERRFAAGLRGCRIDELRTAGYHASRVVLRTA